MHINTLGTFTCTRSMYQVYDHVSLAVKDTSISMDTKFQTIEERTRPRFDRQAVQIGVMVRPRPPGISGQMLFGLVHCSEFWFVLKWPGPSFGP